MTVILRILCAGVLAAGVFGSELAAAEGGSAKGEAAKAPSAPPKPPEGKGWKSLFSGKDFTGWTGDARGKAAREIRWKVIDGVMDNDGKAGHSLWTREEFGDFVLHVEWRFTRTAGKYAMKIILPDGSYKKDADGKVISIPTPNADSGIMLRGVGKGQVNLWCWPCGSGELWSYRNDKKMPPEVRAACVPKVKADKPVGQWNTFVMTMKGERLTVVLNGKTVIDNARLPEIPRKGRIGLQNHGGYNAKRKTFSSATSFVQFRNLWIKPLGD